MEGRARSCCAEYIKGIGITRREDKEIAPMVAEKTRTEERYWKSPLHWAC